MDKAEVERRLQSIDEQLDSLEGQTNKVKELLKQDQLEPLERAKGFVSLAYCMEMLYYRKINQATHLVTIQST